MKTVKETELDLIYYALKIKSFTFINFEIGFKQRVTLTKHFNDGSNSLNIIVEYHYLSMHKYEVTVITALRKNDFYFNDGTYQIELQEDDTSSLNKKEMNRVKQISLFNDV